VRLCYPSRMFERKSDLVQYFSWIDHAQSVFEITFGDRKARRLESEHVIQKSASTSQKFVSLTEMFWNMRRIWFGYLAMGKIKRGKKGEIIYEDIYAIWKEIWLDDWMTRSAGVRFGLGRRWGLILCAKIATIALSKSVPKRTINL
jgi:hypothetical protein